MNGKVYDYTCLTPQNQSDDVAWGVGCCDS